MSGFISPWVVDHDADDFEPRNVTPGHRTPRRAGPGLSAIIEQHEAAALRAVAQRKRASGFLWRAAIAFGLSTLPVLPHWAAMTLFWLTVVFLLAAGQGFYEYRCARIETDLWPD